ncbi:hypothetical protein L3i22_060410 [Actinoplanes sp. L3-i22]|nr:hypothetical protein L3i22_060410 [Actinoplanes sp. L3-i22]
MAVMDFSPSGWAAEFDPSESTGQVVWRPVERWSADGDALVADERRGCLLEARALKGFKRLVSVGKVVGAVPAAPGWKLKLWDDDKDDATAYEVPIAAWIVDAGGAMSPVPAGSDSYLEPVLRQRSEIVAPE